MSEVKDPAIKLFGKTIPLQEISPQQGRCGGGGDDESGQDQDPPSCESYGLDREERETEKDITRDKTTESEQEDGVPPATSEESSNPEATSGVSENPKTSSVEKENDASKNSKTEEEQNDTSSSQEKTLKKPDKILPCPRCNSMDTKFCYYNNYNVNQPRHFCKNCQRYWTAGGTMRNVPVGAGRRKNKNSTSQYRHITVSEALQSVRADIPNGIHHPALKTNGTVLTFGSDTPLHESMASVLNLADKTMRKCTRNGFHKPEAIRVPVSYGSSENGDSQSNGSSHTMSNKKDEAGKSGSEEQVMQNRCSIRMEVPFGDSDKILVSEEYVRFLLRLANEKMEANRKRTEGFLNALKVNGFAEVASVGDCDRDCDDGDAVQLEQTDSDCSNGQVGVPECELSTAPISIIGEPAERLFIWGHTTCALDGNEILVFGGFGGIGRHARRNDLLVLNSLSGELKLVDVEVAPCPRLGHTASLVGNFVVIIGGRADPLNVLNDVWILDTVKKEWKLEECTGSPFLPRHRHAAAVVGSNIYVFGGLNNDGVHSSLHMLNTENMQWKELIVGGDQPCALHSHAMVACGAKLYVFGGYDGERALGDLYSFDVQTCIWKKESSAGKSPHARFSHSMFVYRNFLGLIGGCPVRRHFQELALFDLQVNMWKYVTLNCIGKELLARTTANVVGDDVVLIGGGAACYAFGTKFSQPLKINLLPLMSFKDGNIPLRIGKSYVNDQNGSVKGEKNINTGIPQSEKNSTLIQNPNLDAKAEKSQPIALHWALKLERKYAKLGKDIIKKCGWLDLGRKVFSQADGLHICFPVIEKFYAVFHDKQNQCGDALEGQNDIHKSELFMGDGISLNDISCSDALKILKECRAIVVADDVVEARKTAKSPLQVMTNAVASLARLKGLSEELLEQLPTRWERLGDIVVLPVTSFKDPAWSSFGEELWSTVAKSLNARRLARQGRVASTGTRDSTLEILVGDNGWVEHRENGILYSFDATKCMFSWGNLSEKLRMGNLDCKDEVIVDLFAGIGYFVLPFLVRAKAKMVYACEWNPHAVEALKHNLDANSVSSRCIILEGDNRITAPKGIADRVCLGLIPTSEGSWVTAIRALRSGGGVLHVHGNVKDTEEGSWTEYVTRSMKEIAQSEGHSWQVTIEHVERVKWYGPHIRHLVADVRCRQILR